MNTLEAASQLKYMNDLKKEGLICEEEAKQLRQDLRKEFALKKSKGMQNET